jgi:hypothetical protein
MDWDDRSEIRNPKAESRIADRREVHHTFQRTGNLSRDSEFGLLSDFGDSAFGFLIFLPLGVFAKER